MAGHVATLGDDTDMHRPPEKVGGAVAKVVPQLEHMDWYLLQHEPDETAHGPAEAE